MEKLLWTFDDVVRFVDHPDRPLRRWALERLTKRFPHQAAEALVAMLDDPDSYIADQAVQFLSKTGDGARYGPILLDHLREARGSRFGSLAQALARLDHREALPLILERLKQDQATIQANEFPSLVDALGVFGGDEPRQVLWEILDSISKGTYLVGAAMESMLDAARPQDVARLVQTYRSWPVSLRTGRALRAFASAVGVRHLIWDVEGAEQAGLHAALDNVTRWLGREPELGEMCLDDLAAAFERGHRGVFEVLLDEARRLASRRGDDLAGWREAWEAGERPAGYRREMLYTLLLFEAFAAHPSPLPELRVRESGLGLALVSQLSVNRDDQARLDAAEDRAATLVSILAEDRENVLPNIEERVAALGPQIVPRLVAMLDPDEFGWGMIRAIRAIERLARLHPGSCDAAIPGLIAVMHNEQGDFCLEASSQALEAIGLAAAGPIIEHLRDDDIARQIFLTGVLGEIPTESAARAILAWLADGEPPDEMHFTALAEIGSPSAIEPLYALWKADPDRLLAEQLLILCELNGVQKPELPEWRRTVEADETRRRGLLGDIELAPMPAAPVASEAAPVRAAPRQRTGPKRRPVRKPKTISKRERKKRTAQRRGKRKKKKRKK